MLFMKIPLCLRQSFHRVGTRPCLPGKSSHCPFLAAFNYFLRVANTQMKAYS
jgi:hypothetical protein